MIDIDPPPSPDVMTWDEHGVTIQCGDSKIVITKEGITLSSKFINLDGVSITKQENQ